jgi:site-specific recombinase XerD
MGEVTLKQTLDEFKTVYMPSRNYAPRTREEYLNDVEELVEFLNQAGIVRVGELGLSSLDRYLAHLDNRGLAGATRKRKVIVIRGFLTFLYRNRYLTNDISRQLVPPYGENTLPRILTQSEYQRLLSASSSNIRDHAIVQLLLQTGIRLSELVHLTLLDFDLPGDTEEGELTGKIRVVAGGGRKSRELPLNSKAWQAVKIYLKSRPDVQSNNVFSNNSGKPLGERGVQKMVTKYMVLAGLHGASVHTLRHTFAVQHLVKGTSLETVRDVLGHKDIRTTESYMPLAKEMARKELEANAL